MRCAVNVEICLGYHSLEEILPQLDPASLGRRLQLDTCFFWAAKDAHTFQQMRGLPCLQIRQLKLWVT